LDDYASIVLLDTLSSQKKIIELLPSQTCHCDQRHMCLGELSP
jgi:hypothetical protein